MAVVEGWFCGTYATTVPKKSELPAAALGAFVEGISQNSKAVLMQSKVPGLRPDCIGSKTEGALLAMIVDWGADYLAVRATPYTKLFPFSSARKTMSVLVEHAGAHRLYQKGASEIVLSRCSQVCPGW